MSPTIPPFQPKGVGAALGPAVSKVGSGDANVAGAVLDKTSKTEGVMVSEAVRAAGEAVGARKETEKELDSVDASGAAADVGGDLHEQDIGEGLESMSKSSLPPVMERSETADSVQIIGDVMG